MISGFSVIFDFQTGRRDEIRVEPFVPISSVDRRPELAVPSSTTCFLNAMHTSRWPPPD